MDYFVTGGTGFLGTKTIESLVADGHVVVALTRSRANASHLPDAVTVVEGDVTDKASMREAMTGVDGVFHMAGWGYVGPGRRHYETAERINVDGTRNVLELMDELDVPKGVYTSTVGVYGSTGGRTVDESVHPDNPGTCVYFRTKWRAHYEVAKPMMESGLPLVVVLPGVVFGAGDKEYGSAREAFLNWLRDDLPVLPEGVALPYDYVDDTVRGIRLAMSDGVPGEDYIIANDAREVVDLFECAERITGKPAPRSVSRRWFWLFGKLLTPVEWVTTPPEGFEPEKLRVYGSTGIRVDNSKAERELGLDHRPLAAGLREYLEWELAQLEDVSGLDAETIDAGREDTDA
ncbi:MAG: NAD-dependent epimerase/dehydratase family protein [Halobacterium sp.]